MNFSNAFKRGFDNFCALTGMPPDADDINIASLEKSRVFSYLIPRGGFYPVLRTGPATSFVFPIYYHINENTSGLNTQEGTTELRKAEEIFTGLCSAIRVYRLNGEIFYAARGMVFDSEKNPIILLCGHESGASNILCFDYSVLESPEKVMNRFFLRKVLPYILEQRARRARDCHYTFINGKDFVVKPTFQGELDEGLVREFLIHKVSSEYDLSRPHK